MKLKMIDNINNLKTKIRLFMIHNKSIYDSTLRNIYYLHIMSTKIALIFEFTIKLFLASCLIQIHDN